MNDDTITMTEKDYLRIQHLLSVQTNLDNEDLEIELDRARVISDYEVPHDLVTMNSKIRFEILQSKKEMVITLVYPHEANSEAGMISILAPLGTALIGLRVGQNINWMFPDGETKTLKIQEILYQPEANQDWHL